MKLAIFDMGGVVCGNTRVGPFIIEHLGISSAEFYSLANKAGLKGLETGKITMEEFWQRFAVEYGQQVEEDLWRKFFKPEPIVGTLEVIEELKKHTRVVAGTNTIDSHYAVHKERGDYDIFDAVYASHQIGFAKPDAEFYRWILAEEGSPNPAEVIFVDDLLENVEAARSIGINGIHFTDPRDLRAQLPWLSL